ncbi:MAG: ATPase [Proteobacteria bacterium]|nr:ATPase [Pseudomonadota bacterium]
MAQRELAPTRIALLELLEERGSAREGYALLDEKRTLLAARMLALLARHAAACRDWRAALDAAERALAAALDRHGVRELEWAPEDPVPALAALHEQRVLGVRVPQVTPATEPPPASVPPDAASPERAAAREAYRRLLELALALAASECALWRLADEYQRTERRAGAIEHLLLPELERDIAVIEAALEAIEQEEALRVRRARAAPRAGAGALESGGTYAGR